MMNRRNVVVRDLLLLTLATLIPLLMYSSPAEALICNVPTPGYPDLFTAFSSGCTVINFVGNVSDTSQISVTNPSGDIIILGNGYTWTSTFSGAKLVLTNNQLASINFMVRDLTIVFPTQGSLGQIEVYGSVNASFVDVFIDYQQTTYGVYIEANNVVTSSLFLRVSGVMRGAELSNTFISVVLRYDMDYIIFDDIDATNVFMAIVVSSIQRDVNLVRVDDVTGDGGVRIGGFRDLDGVKSLIDIRNIFITGSGWVSTDISFIGGYGDVTIYNVTADGDGAGISILNIDSRLNIRVDTVRQVFTGAPFNSFRVSSGFGPSADMNLSVRGLSTTGSTYGANIYVQSGRFTMDLQNGFIGSVATAVNAIVDGAGTEAVMRFYNVSASDLRVGGYNIISRAGANTTAYLVNTTVVFSPPGGFAGISLLSQPTLLSDNTHLSIYGLFVNVSGPVTASLYASSIDPTSRERMNGSFFYSVFDLVFLSDSVEINMTETVYNEFTSIIGLDAKMFSQWTLGVRALSIANSNPVPNYRFKLLVSGVEVATLNTDSTGTAYYTFTYQYDPLDPMIDDIEILDPSSGDRYNLNTDLSYVTTIPSWYDKVEIDVVAIYLVARGFVDGLGDAILTLETGRGTLTILRHGSATNIPIIINGVAPVNNIGVLRIAIFYGGEWVETYMVINGVRRMVWIPGPIEFIGWY